MKNRISQKATILVVDDEDMLLNTKKKLLDPWFNKVYIANTPSAGLRIVETENIDLMLVDHRMSEMRGTELMKLVHKIVPVLPIIMVTAYPDDDVIKAFEEQDFDIVEKPYKPEILLRRIQNLLVARYLIKILRALAAEVPDQIDPEMFRNLGKKRQNKVLHYLATQLQSKRLKRRA